ncbi:MAG TPA: hypothetical protein VMJ73_14930 [Rhizomicrobium sp.]|nr:hypothetical protein [Rhizomicrobium sp.]
MGNKRRDDVAHHHLFGNRRIVDATDARQVRFHEFQSVLPRSAGKIAHGVEPTIDGIVLGVIGRPDLPQPVLLFGTDGERFADAGVLKKKRWKPLQRFGDLLTDIVDVGELLASCQDWPQHDSHRLGHAVMLVDHLVGDRIETHALGNLPVGVVRNVVSGAFHAAFERGARQP